MSMLNREVAVVPEDSVPRFLKYVEKGPGCWTWLGCRKGNGYGRFVIRDGGRERELTAHRFAHAAFIGPVPEGLVVDHLCRNRACVNPAHLEAVTHQENMRRGKPGVLRVPEPWRIEARELHHRGLTRREIADQLGQGLQRVANTLADLPPNALRCVCAGCGADFESHNRKPRFCCRRCCWTHHNNQRRVRRAQREEILARPAWRLPSGPAA